MVSVDSDSKKSDGRWWEFYFVRYFVGTAIGALILLFLCAVTPLQTDQGEFLALLNLISPKQESGINISTGYVIVLTAIGLAFCYIASAPILVFHATRGALLKTIFSRSNKSIASNIVSKYVIIIVTITALPVVCLNKYQCLSKWHYFLASITFLATSTILVSQIALLWLSRSNGDQAALIYYEDLVSRRATADGVGKEYIESYRHLREHGNAFFIAVLEIILGATLYYSPFSSSLVLVLWMLPAVGVWLFGTRMEERSFPQGRKVRRVKGRR
jgi:hypothetical protein